jgi:hypothetical protein
MNYSVYCCSSLLFHIYCLELGDMFAVLPFKFYLNPYHFPNTFKKLYNFSK